MTLSKNIAASAALLLFIPLLNSCSIEKRKYLDGYHIDRVSHSSEAKNSNTQKSLEKEKSLEEESPEIRSISAPNPDERNVIEKSESISSSALIQREKELANEPVINDSITPQLSSGSDDYLSFRNGPIEHPLAVKCSKAGFASLGTVFANILFSAIIGTSTYGAQAASTLSAGLFLFGLVAAILAITWGKHALREIRADPKRYTSEHKARTGITLGWVYIGLLILSLILLLLLIILFIAAFGN